MGNSLSWNPAGGADAPTQWLYQDAPPVGADSGSGENDESGAASAGSAAGALPADSLHRAHRADARNRLSGQGGEVYQPSLYLAGRTGRPSRKRKTGGEDAGRTAQGADGGQRLFRLRAGNQPFPSDQRNDPAGGRRDLYHCRLSGDASDRTKAAADACRQRGFAWIF